MKSKTLIVLLFVAFVAGLGGWWAARHQGHNAGDHAGEAGQSGRKIRFYQCSMHPQVKSDKPGSKCTICGMALSPIFEGQSELTENLVTLSPSTIQVVNVQTAPVRRSALQRVIHVAGTIDDDDTKHRIIAAYIDGRIEKLFVNFTGAEVTQGEPLATFYSPGLLTAEREYLLLAQRQLTNGNPELLAEQKRFLDAAGQRLQRLGLTEQQIKQLGKETNSVARSTIVAPMSGTVVSRMAYEGQYVKEGDRLFEIADFSTMWFKFDAYEQDLPWMKAGQKVEVETPSVPGRTFEGEITFIDPNINDPTRSAKVRVNLENPIVEENGKKRRLLLHRLFAEGSVRVETPESLVIPRTAVLNPGGAPVVYVDVGESSYEARKVKLGLRGDEGWQVLEGLTEGEKVVTYGNTLIDAQAQLNQSSQSPEEQHGHEDPVVKPVGNLEKINDVQRSGAEALLAQTSRMAANLAADDMKAFNEGLPAVGPALASFTNSWAGAKSWQSLVEPIQAHGEIQKAGDLAAARKAFHPFSMAVTELTKHLRAHEKAFEGVKIYHCPMVNQAVPGAPKNGFWVQLNGPLQNPFFGSDMLECGMEVAP